jgi:2-iminobutanoate/2-iminopropanoate deaminase
MTAIRRPIASAAPAPTGPFAQAVRAGDFVYTAVRGIDPASGEPVPGDPASRVHRMFENLRAILDAAGSGLPHVVSTTVYVRDMFRHRPVINDLYTEFFGAALPTRTILEVARLNQDDDVEITATAWCPGGGGPAPVRLPADTLHAPTGPFAQGIRVGSLLFLSGQRGLDPKTVAPVPGPFEGRARQLFTNIGRVLRAGGSDFQHVLATTVYVRDMFRHRPVINELYTEFFGAALPARAIVEVPRLNQDDDVEITASPAVIP